MDGSRYKKVALEVTAFDENLFYLNWGTQIVFGPSISNIKLFLNLFIRFFWNHPKSDCFKFCRKIHMLKDALSDLRQFLATERELFKNDEKWFLFHLIFFSCLTYLNFRSGFFGHVGKPLD